ncbi:MAG: DUF3179 domain-containing protein [Planctomycetes bacterium]|nr:DUF3179 domain-containing protein [Planctomycetota bacterium]
MELSKPTEAGISEKDGESPSTRRFFFFHYQPRPRLYTALALLALGLFGWRLYADRDYWNKAWAQRSLFLQNSAEPSFAQFSPRPRRPSFDLSNVTVPASEILSGGPPKDGIPALTNPKFTAAVDAVDLGPEDRVIGLSAPDQAKAYPLRILNYHEIVNDRVGDLPVAVTYCPLCDSCAVFDRRTELGEHEFGVSGLLYNSNVLMFDRGGNPESLWSQIQTQGVSGPGAKKTLAALPLELTTWGNWLARHPETLVLSSETGHPRDYGRNPYEKYFSTPRLMFPVELTSDRLPAKSRILGVWTDSMAKAYPESYFSESRLRVEEMLDGKKIVIQYNPAAGSLRVTQADQGVRWMYSLWFAWYAFHPETDVHGQ